MQVAREICAQLGHCLVGIELATTNGSIDGRGRAGCGRLAKGDQVLGGLGEILLSLVYVDVVAGRRRVHGPFCREPECGGRRVGIVIVHGLEEGVEGIGL